ncbi:MAG: hypothetical protein ACTHN4_04825, partial [Sphingomicrobium sp.]
MLQQELPLLDSRPVGGASVWLVPAIAAAAAVTGAGILWIAGQPTAALLFLAVFAVGVPAAVLLRKPRPAPTPDLQQLVAAPDFSLVGSILGLIPDA